MNDTPPIVIAGATGGMGSAIARALARSGRSLVLTGRSRGRLEKIQARIAAETGAAPDALVMDVAEPASVETAIATIRKRHRAVAGYVHAAGEGPVGALADTTDALWREAFEVKLFGAVRVLRLLLPLIEAGDDASIVLIGGVFAREPHPLFPISSALNSATAALGKALAKDLQARGVRVNVLHPGATRTELWARIANEVGKKTGTDGAEVTASAAGSMIGGTLLEPDDIGQAITFLMSKAARRVTGSVLLLDGGETRALS